MELLGVTFGSPFVGEWLGLPGVTVDKCVVGLPIGFPAVAAGAPLVGLVLGLPGVTVGVSPSLPALDTAARCSSLLGGIPLTDESETIELSGVGVGVGEEVSVSLA